MKNSSFSLSICGVLNSGCVAFRWLYSNDSGIIASDSSRNPSTSAITSCSRARLMKNRSSKPRPDDSPAVGSATSLMLLQKPSLGRSAWILSTVSSNSAERLCLVITGEAGEESSLSNHLLMNPPLMPRGICARLVIFITSANDLAAEVLAAASGDTGPRFSERGTAALFRTDLREVLADPGGDTGVCSLMLLLLLLLL